ncbi:MULTISPECIES: hypothetical protein [Bacillaceae]|uniref:hypothetical protein n=1 Tax=Bacillaceae TaxID=186817 RepID=UPI001A8BFB25|nr:hypothetical protein [Bacillus sp. NTK034]MBN8203640.1 hypothetical protein [Bacillus sp. NTK034]
MKVGMAPFIGGLILLMSCIFLSAYWTVAGSFMGIFGGMMMGSSSYFLAKPDKRQVKR